MFFSIRSHRFPCDHVCVNHFLYFFQIVKELHLLLSAKADTEATRLEYRFSLTSRDNWWRLTGSNRRPPACKAGALPAELNPHLLLWWVWLDSNQRPPRYQHGALTS